MICHVHIVSELGFEARLVASGTHDSSHHDVGIVNGDKFLDRAQKENGADFSTVSLIFFSLLSTIHNLCYVSLPFLPHKWLGMIPPPAQFSILISAL